MLRSALAVRPYFYQMCLFQTAQVKFTIVQSAVDVTRSTGSSAAHPLLILSIARQILSKKSLLVKEPPDYKGQHEHKRSEAPYEPSASGVPTR